MSNLSVDLTIRGTFISPLSLAIQKEYNKFREAVKRIATEHRKAKNISFTGGNVSVADLIAYQIGWGKRVIEWYETGIAGKTMVMPGDGFKTFSYTAMALHFYKFYLYDAAQKQDQEFHNIVIRILEIVEKEYKTGNLDKKGVWGWCRLHSGKEWTLNKWITVNTSSPYKRATSLIIGLNNKDCNSPFQIS